MKYIFSIFSLFTFSLGCSNLDIHRVASFNYEPTEGLRLQIPTPHKVITIIKQPNGDWTRQATDISLPSRKEHYDLKFKGNLFTDSDLIIDFHPGGSLKSFELTKSSDADTALSALGGSLEKVNTTLEDIEKKKKEDAVDPLDAENQKLGQQIMNLMLEANKEAIAQGKTPPYPNFLKP